MESCIWLAGRDGKLQETFRTPGWVTPSGLDLVAALRWFDRNKRPLLIDRKTLPHRSMTRFLDRSRWSNSAIALIPLHLEEERLGLQILVVPDNYTFTQPQREVLPVLSSVVLASARLVAELRRRREEASQSRAEATRLRLNGDFAHRIRKAVDPMLRDVHAIRAELYRRGVALDGELRQWLDDIEEGCTELARAPEELRRAGIAGPVELRQVLSALRNRMALEFPDVEIDLRVEPARYIVLAIRGDVTALFENVLYNAVEAMDGFGAVEVSVQRDGSSAVVTISDEGPGVAEELREDVFILGHSSKIGKGRGSGLARSRQIVTDLEGSIRVGVPLLGGATFVINIPTIDRSDS